MDGPGNNTLERRKPSSKFYLDDMGSIFDRTAGKADIPHRHDYYTVLFIVKATGRHVIDYKTYTLSEREVHFVGPGQVHQVAVDQRPTGCVFTFSRDFLAENNIPESFISNINLFRTFGDSPPLKIDDATFVRLSRIIEEMKSCMPDDLTFRLRALGALLQLFLIYCNNSTMFDPLQTDEENTGVCILRDFKDLVETHYSDWHKVSRYAREIHITPKHLSQTVKSLTGKSAKAVIQDRLILESKRLLLHTDLNIKEIAYAVGFEEPLHFSSFFKKEAGLSPSAFREQRRRQG